MSSNNQTETLYGLLAEYDTPGELMEGAEKIRDAGFTKWDCYTPFPVHGLDKAMGIRMTILPWIVFICGVGGLGGGILLQWWTNTHHWPWLVSGKPFFSLPANIPIAFETTILASVFAAFLGMWALNKLPAWWHPFFKKERFLKATDDKFFIGVEAEDDAFDADETRAILTETGATAVEECHIDASPQARKMPTAIFAFIIVSAVLALLPFALIAKARSAKSDKPHWHIIPDMDFQGKAKAQAHFDFFENSHAARGAVAGTVARGEDKLDDHYYRGLVGGEWATTFPVELTGDQMLERAMDRGQERYRIYCAPCHGDSGGVDNLAGMVDKRAKKVPNRGWVAPANLHREDIVKQPHGQLFNTISNGRTTMPGYSAQINEFDRWTIVLYLRALQRSQRASRSDVPDEKLQDIR
jgi:mono/diheme cytochrome c family protein